MGRQLKDLSVVNLDDLPSRCRTCVFWELGPASRAGAFDQDPAFEKETWLSEAGLLGAPCGKVAYVDGVPAGFALYGPPGQFAGAEAFPARVSRDALFLATLHVRPEDAGRGLGKVLVQAALRDAKEHGKRAIEAFGDRQWQHPACVVPAAFYESVGFRVRREHPRFPLMRIDVRSLAKLTRSVEAAVGALLESVLVRGEPVARPAR